MLPELRIYRLVPQAPPGDANWQNSPFRGEVIVRALSTGDARLVAAQAEGDFMDTNAKPAEGVSTLEASAFLNEKLYTVVLEANHERYGIGLRGVVEEPSSATS